MDNVERDDAAESPELLRVKERAQDVREDVNALASETVLALRKAVDDLSTLLSSNALDARDLGFMKLDEISASIQRRPLAAVGLAAGLGLIVGLWRHRDGR